MKLSNKHRFLKVFKDLSSRPSNLPRYVSCLPFWNRNSLSLAMPWWSFSAIDFISSQCLETHEVFEYGSGGSTVFFARRCKKVTAIEDDAGWQQSLAVEIQTQSLENVEVSLRPFDFVKGEGFTSSDYLSALDKFYDIIVVDGQDWSGDTRPACFARAEEHIREGGMIIVDDSWRYAQLRECNRAKRFEVFESVGPCRVGVTSTDIYFY